MREIFITHLYPDLLNLYGDKGNISVLEKRLEWRGIAVKVNEVSEGNLPDLDNTDILFLGGGSQKEQKIVCDTLLKIKDKLTEFIEDDKVLLALCGGFPMLGKYPETENITGLDILNIETHITNQRTIGNAVAECDIDGEKFNIVGFENHTEKTDIKGFTPLAKMISRNGNEGIIYKNVFASYLHGPLLPKNPKLADIILKRALTKKYGEVGEFRELSDELETNTNQNLQTRFLNL